MPTAIHWFRRDLRIADNTALNAAVAAHNQVAPVFILSEWKREHSWCDAARQEFLCGCLRSLAKDLQAKGGRLFVRQGRAELVLEKLIRETGAEAIYFARDPDPSHAGESFHAERRDSPAADARDVGARGGGGDHRARVGRSQKVTRARWSSTARSARRRFRRE